MTQIQFQYTRLPHQDAAVTAIADVFADVHFYAPEGSFDNPHFKPHESHKLIKGNIEALRAAANIKAGKVHVPSTRTPALNIDVLMETGTGKTFTFIEAMHRLHQQHKLSKFVVLVPSNAIRQGTLKSLQSTAAFFAREYSGQRVSVFNYSPKTVQQFIHAPNRSISVLVATYQSFNKDKNTINQRGVEANLFGGRAKSYMEALAALKPVLIIDEPHRFEGKQTQEYLARFEPQCVLRLGATFKDDDFCNLIYTLDSQAAFAQRLVKGITVDTVGATHAGAEQSLLLTAVTGTAGARVAHISYTTPAGKTAQCVLEKKGNLGTATGLDYLSGHVAENITAKELLFTNGFSLPLGEPAGFGMLADEMQRMIIQRAIDNHFEREEELFKRGIKALSLFFIDAVAKYLPEGGKPAVIKTTFEQLYAAKLAQVLAQPSLDAGYRKYLERTQHAIDKVHKGYFARSLSEKGEEEAIKLILQEKEKLLQFDTDLRFIFSMWALQEGWDNPNVFTLCKLAPSHSKISKLQQIGRGLRLAVNQQLQRVQADDADFDSVNDLVVVVPASEGDFVKAIQGEIAAHSVQKVAQVFNGMVLADIGISQNMFALTHLLTALAQAGVMAVDETTGNAHITMDRHTFAAQRPRIEAAVQAVAGIDGTAMMRYLDSYYGSYGQVRHKPERKPHMLTPRPAHYAHFKALWEHLNRDAVLHYDIDSAALVASAVVLINDKFAVQPLGVQVTTAKAAHEIDALHQVRESTATYQLKPQPIYTLGEFVQALANGTRLSLHTISSILLGMEPHKFAQIKTNENRALRLLQDLILRCVYDLIVNKLSYEVREIHLKKTALTDKTGALLKTISAALCGADLHDITNPVVQEKSLFDEPHMPVDSQIERETTDDTTMPEVTVFAKLPKVDIPTPAGKYNPDFGFVIAQAGKPQAMYLVVETKGYNSMADVDAREMLKINSAKRFFAALQAQGVPVHYRTRVNSDNLTQLVQSICTPSSA